VTVDTGFGPHTRLHDYTGHSGDTWTDGAGRATITVPRNRDGLGYACFSRDGQGLGFDIGSHGVTQEFEGAPDLDIGPASSTPNAVGRIWVEKGKAIAVRLAKLGGDGLPPAAALVVELRGPVDASVLGTAHFPEAGAPALRATAKRGGWHSIVIHLDGAPAGATRSFTLSVSYTAPTHSTPAELRG
jgi:alpha-amylase